MSHRRPARLAPAMALLCVLPGLLAACGGDPAADIGEAASPTSASPLTEPDGAAAKSFEDQSATGTMSKPKSGVSREAAEAYTQAVAKLRPAFDRFTSDYADATARMKAEDVLAAAARLRRAVVTFDGAVRGLDLAAVQGHVDALLALNDDFVATLGDVGTATSGAQAVRIMEMLPFRDYVLAYDAVAGAL